MRWPFLPSHLFVNPVGRKVISFLQKRREEEIIVILDEIESAKNKVEEEKKKFEEEKEKVEKEKAVINQESDKEKKRLEDLLARREELVSSIEKKVYDRYQRILDNRGRVALTVLNNDFCGECNMQLRPQIINEVRLSKGLVFCENCGRIIHAEE